MQDFSSLLWRLFAFFGNPLPPPPLPCFHYPYSVADC